VVSHPIEVPPPDGSTPYPDRILLPPLHPWRCNLSRSSFLRPTFFCKESKNHVYLLHVPVGCLSPAYVLLPPPLPTFFLFPGLALLHHFSRTTVCYGSCFPAPARLLGPCPLTVSCSHFVEFLFSPNQIHLASGTVILGFSLSSHVGASHPRPLFLTLMPPSRFLSLLPDATRGTFHALEGPPDALSDPDLSPGFLF